MTPLCLANRSLKLQGVRVMPFPGPRFCPSLSLISRAGELDKIAPRLARTSQGILRKKYLPKMAQLGPWLDGQVSVGD